MFNLLQTTATESRTCEQHGNFISSYITIRDQSKWTNCPECIKNMIAKETLAEIENNRLDSAKTALESVLKRGSIPEAYRDKSFDNFNAYNPALVDALNRCKRFADNFQQAKKQNTHGVFLGGTGVGKTHLAIAIVRRVIELGYTSMFIKMADIIQVVKESWSKKNVSEKEVLHNFIDIDLLVIDECGITSNDVEREKLFYIVDKRYESGRPVIIISNEIEDLKKKIGDRVVSRLFESKFIIAFEGGDYRMEGISK